MDFNFEILQHHSNLTELQLSGSLDSNSYRFLEDGLTELLDSGNLKIVINLKDLDYISSAGIRVVIKTQKIVQAKRGELYFMKMKPQVRKVFEIINALPFIRLIDHLEEIS